MTGPARPYRVINNFVVSKPRDFSEDLSGKSTALALRNQSPVLLLRVPRGWTSHLSAVPGTGKIIQTTRGQGVGGGTVFKEEGAGLENKDRSPTVWGHMSYRK